MKKIIIYSAPLCFCLFFGYSIVNAQSGSEIKFNVRNNSLPTDKNLVTVSAIINTKQAVSDKGIQFVLVVRNNSGKAIFIKNIADQLLVSLYNKSGADIAIINRSLLVINRNPRDRKWKFRSESVHLDRVYINGKEEKGDFKQQEYIEIPAAGTCKVDLAIKNVKQADTREEVRNKTSIPIINVTPGRYKLKMALFIVDKEQNRSGGFVASYESPMVDINYGD